MTVPKSQATTEDAPVVVGLSPYVGQLRSLEGGSSRKCQSLGLWVPQVMCPTGFQLEMDNYFVSIKNINFKRNWNTTKG